jgi:hypothetical protein
MGLIWDENFMALLLTELKTYFSLYLVLRPGLFPHERRKPEFFGIRILHLTQMPYRQPFHSNLKAFYYTIKHRHCKALANCNSWPEIGNTSEKGKTIERW